MKNVSMLIAVACLNGFILSDCLNGFILSDWDLLQSVTSLQDFEFLSGWRKGAGDMKKDVWKVKLWKETGIINSLFWPPDSVFICIANSLADTHQVMEEMLMWSDFESMLTWS